MERALKILHGITNSFDEYRKIECNDAKRCRCEYTILHLLENLKRELKLKSQNKDNP